MITTHRLMCFAAISLASLSSTALGADEWIKPGEERVKLGAGAFLPSFDTSVRINTNRTGGGGISLEDDLGLKASDSTGYAFATWRVAPKHRLSIGYFAFHRDASATAEKDIEIGDGEVIQVGASTQTQTRGRSQLIADFPVMQSSHN